VSGVYVHIPYCRQRCPYCDFNIAVHAAPPWDAFLAALLRDLDCDFPGPAQTVYFGGGTPSLAPPSLLGAVLEAIDRRIGLAGDPEITAEVEPGADVAFAELAAAGITRVSLGWQSTDDSVLRVLGRGHDARANMHTLERARGFRSVSIDLIFGVPEQSHRQLARDLEAALSANHVSIYELTYHPGTQFYGRRRQAASEGWLLDALAQIAATLGGAGFERYEVSNFARPGHRSRHNQKYWRGEPTLGVGPGAVSYRPSAQGAERTRARRSVSTWIQDGGIDLAETLTPEQVALERLFCGLRTADGIAAVPVLAPRAAKAIAAGLLEAHDGRWVPTARGMQLADALAADLAAAA
jgi:oxygen-independent coproporphyrinogen-3 oxidase